jgi:hypothetical protein
MYIYICLMVALLMYITRDRGWLQARTRPLVIAVNLLSTTLDLTLLKGLIILEQYLDSSLWCTIVIWYSTLYIGLCYRTYYLIFNYLLKYTIEFNPLA